MTIGIAIQLVLNGIGLGMIYLLIVLGLDVMLRGTKIINFAQGQFYMLGGYVFFVMYRTLDVGFWLSVVCAALAIAVLGAVCYYGVFNPVQRQFTVGATASYRLLMTAMASVGLMMILQQSAVLCFGTSEMGVPPAFPQILSFGDVSFPMKKLVTVLLSLLLLFILYLFFFRTKLGKAIRAVSFDPEVGSLQGINTFQVFLVCFAVGSALAGVAGAMAVSLYGVSPMMGTHIIFIALLIMVLGGLGSYKGAALGALIVGLGLSFGYQFFSDLSHVLVSALVLLVLIFRPGGILGEALD